MTGEQLPPILRAIDYSELRERWRSEFFPALEKLANERHGGVWMPEDVWATVRMGHAYFIDVANGQGFMVVQRQPRFAGDCLFVWVICGKLAPYEQQIYDALDGLAAQMGVRTIEAQGRRGWLKRGFFEESGTTFVREVRKWAVAAAAK